MITQEELAEIIDKKSAWKYSEEKVLYSHQARDLGISRPHFDNIRNGKIDLRLSQLIELSKYYKVDLFQYFRFEGKEKELIDSTSDIETIKQQLETLQKTVADQIKKIENYENSRPDHKTD